MSKLFPLARMTSTTVGTGTLTLSAAVSGYLTFALAGVTNGQWVTYGIKDGANSEVGYGQYTSAGTTLSRNVLFSTNSNALISCSGSEEVYITAAPTDYNFPDNWLTGLTLSNDGVSPNTVLDIAAGIAADSTNTDLMRLASAITKTTGSWAVGSGNGGLDTGAVAASTWYHVYLIRRPDTGVVDVLFSTSASAPTMPTSYTQKRRIGSFLTNGSSQIIAFSQNGDEFLWGTSVNDVNAFNLTNVSTLFTLTVPLGVKVNALAYCWYLNNTTINAIFVVQSPDLAAQTPNTPLYNFSGQGASLSAYSGGLFSIRVNTSQQIRAVSNQAANNTFGVDTIGWIDTRGKLG